MPHSLFSLNLIIHISRHEVTLTLVKDVRVHTRAFLLTSNHCSLNLGQL